MYCYTPVRVFYDQRDRFIASAGDPLMKLAIMAWTSLHSRLDRRSIRRVERMATTSANTARRIEKYYRRKAIPAYPPCDTARYHYSGDDGFWLSVNRLYPEKRIEIQLQAFEQMPEERLVIVGNSGTGDHSEAYARRLKSMLPPNVTILSDLEEEDLVGYYSRCRGVISTAIDEDFGMTAVEAMASGKPVIAPAEGGYLESVIDGRTGRLVDCTPEALASAVKEVSKDPTAYRDACIERAKKFDVSVFLREMDGLIERAPF
jgi:glycosyltransferase involved in cell wall biosynthesis